MQRPVVVARIVCVVSVSCHLIYEPAVNAFIKMRRLDVEPEQPEKRGKTDDKQRNPGGFWNGLRHGFLKHRDLMPSGAELYLSIVVPVYNEALRLPLSLQRMVEHFGQFALPHEVLIVVEHSTDGTLELAQQAVAKQANFRVIDNEVQRGKGFAVRTGMLQARGEFIFYMDADLSVPLEEISRFLKHFEARQEYHILVGNRQHPESRIELRQTSLREKMGQLFNRLLRSLSLLEIKDTQCGFKAFRREAAREIFARQTIDGFAFDVEVLLLAEALGFQITDLPVRWINSPQSKVHIVRDSLRMLLDTLTIRCRIRRDLSLQRESARELAAKK
jgi:dolichyl-phosphate beta-glucosyltransferase